MLVSLFDSFLFSKFFPQLLNPMIHENNFMSNYYSKISKMNKQAIWEILESRIKMIKAKFKK